MGLENQPRCPYCGHTHNTAWAWDFKAEQNFEVCFKNCEVCRKQIKVSRKIMAMYFTEEAAKKEQK
jgi:hypothetical protein